MTEPLIAQTRTAVQQLTPAPGGALVWNGPGGPGHPSTWRGFLTRLCAPCEVIEQRVYLAYIKAGQFNTGRLPQGFTAGFSRFGPSKEAAGYVR